VSAVAEATGWYVFGVVASPAPMPAGVVAEGSLAALVEPVSLAEFGREALVERLNDREWLETHARAHQDVLQAACAAAPVVPLRFGTIFDDLEDVRAMLRSRRHELEAALEYVRGRVEIGVKAWVAPASAEARRPAAPVTGRAYLEQRLGARVQAEEASAALAEVARAAHERLLACSVEAVANRPQPRELTGRDEPMILNGAYLVDDADAFRAEVAALAAGCAARGIDFEVTGPWPPYNFVGDGVAP